MKEEIINGEELFSPEHFDKLIGNKEKRKIAFFVGVPKDDKFLTDIYEFTKQHFSVKIFDGANIDQVYELMKWSDISWFEWCVPMAVAASKLSKVCKVIIRLHRFEAYNVWPSQVNWNNVDTLITVGNSFVKAILLKQVPNIESLTHCITIPNGVNLDKFKFVDRSQGKNIACIGYLNMRKNPMFLLQCMCELNSEEEGYKLFFAGNFQDVMLEQYVKHITKKLRLESVVFFEDWQNDINAWLKDKHYIVSGSIGESQGMGIMEGMARGLKPVIHNFPGADEIFLPKYLFETTADFCHQICWDSYSPQEYRSYIEGNFSLQKQLIEIDKVLKES